MNTETSGSTRPVRPVLVGVDDSESSISAVRWAAEEAVARGLPLELLHVTPYDQPIAPAGPHGAQSVLARGRTVARRHVDVVDVRTRLVTGAAATAFDMAEQHGWDVVVVVGTRNRGPAARILLGSTSRGLLRHSQVPVVVVGPEVRHDDSGDTPERASRAARPTRRVPVAGGPSSRPGG